MLSLESVFKITVCVFLLTCVFGALSVYPMMSEKVVYLEGEPDSFLHPLIVALKYPSTPPSVDFKVSYNPNAVGEGYDTFPNKEQCPILIRSSGNRVHVEGFTDIPVEDFRWWRNYKVVRFNYPNPLGMIIENSFYGLVFVLLGLLIFIGGTVVGRRTADWSLFDEGPDHTVEMEEIRKRMRIEAEEASKKREEEHNAL